MQSFPLLKRTATSWHLPESGKVVDSYGGGICQVSTTLYNAVLNAELEVLERHNHTMIVTYVDPSKDAAIAEGLMDLRFANNTDYLIYISGYAYGGELTFTIYGHETRDPNRTVEYVSETTGTTTADGVALYATDQPVGYLSQTQEHCRGLPRFCGNMLPKMVRRQKNR